MKPVYKIPEKNSPNRRKKLNRYLVIQRDGFKCKLCSATKNLSIDHILPTSFGGKDKPENMQILCSRCHKEIDKFLTK